MAGSLLGAAMPSAGSDRLLGELTYQDVSSTITARSVLILPVGSIEQHGPHLPLNTDVVIAEGIASRIVARSGEALDLWRLPPVSVSLAREHEWAAGTLSLSTVGMTALLRDLGRTIARALPTRNLFILNGHGGNRGILEALVCDLRADFGMNVCVFHPAALSDGTKEGGVAEIHGGKNETSIMLALAPHLVRRERIAPGGKIENPKIVEERILDLSVTWPWSSGDARLSAHGVIGDPREATAEFGEGLIETVVSAAGKIIKQLLDEERR
jgi:creatinine amidohydrolase/Fe(II)-dependent formamide hydrolase-like protein